VVWGRSGSWREPWGKNISRVFGQTVFFKGNAMPMRCNGRCGLAVREMAVANVVAMVQRLSPDEALKL